MSEDHAPREGSDRENTPGDAPDAPRPSLFRINRSMIFLLVAGGIAALLIFWLEPSFTVRYVVVGVLSAIYVFMRFNDWR